MSRPIYEKINRLLTERGQKKKDLAKALGISPQTMTDIVKGRSSVTLSHLKGLVRFFDLRADYWIDDEREDPVETDNQGHAHVNASDARTTDARAEGANDRGGILRTGQQRFITKLRSFVLSNQDAWIRFHGPLERQEKELLGIREEARSVESGVEPVGEQRSLEASE